MDPHRVDELARALGRKADRRTALRGILAAVLGAAVVPAQESAAACVANGKACGGALGSCCSGMICDAKTGKCLGLVGSSCRTTRNCVSGLSCKSSVCRGALVCRKVREACTPTASQCCSMLACDNASATCLTALGFACGTNRDCANGATCRGGVCAIAGAAGEVCDEDPDCAAGLTCNKEEGVCRAPLAGACVSNADCGAGRACIARVCTETTCPGTPCPAGKTCWDGKCVTPLTCATNPTDGLCWETTNGLRAGTGDTAAIPCDSADDCLDSWICGDPTDAAQGKECVCLARRYYGTTLVETLGHCGSVRIDRVAGDQCRLPGQCGRGLHCDKGVCRAMRDGECYQVTDCDTDTEDCCDGECIDTAESFQNCGFCGHACSVGQLCCGYSCIDVGPNVMSCP